LALIALGFVFGAWLLQQQSALPSYCWLLFLPACFFIAIYWRHKPNACSPYTKTQRLFIYSLLASLTGFFYAAAFAHYRLSDDLAKAWERQDVAIIGVVASLPHIKAHGERFRFDVERVITPNAQVPQHIALNFYRANAWQQISKPEDKAYLFQPTTFKAGQRWQLTVRLKRPHTTYNPSGYDFEAWALSENIRAMGYVRNKAPMRQLTNFVWRPRYMIAYCREHIGRRMTQVLRDKPYAGVIRALVIGDHSQINAQNWDVYLRTGTNHLMSISGLHITMLAGLAFSFIALCWRRFPHLVVLLPTRKAAIIGGAVVALLYACLAGLSVPTQRTLIMLMTFAIALLLNKRVPMSRVLIVALLAVVLVDPWAVIAPGFWLSFSAVAFITYAAVNRLKVRHWLAEAVNTQWSVTLGLLPFLILMFG